MHLSPLYVLQFLFSFLIRFNLLEYEYNFYFVFIVTAFFVPKFFTEMFPKEFLLSGSEFSFVMNHYSNSFSSLFRDHFDNSVFVIPVVTVVVIPGTSDCKEQGQ